VARFKFNLGQRIFQKIRRAHYYQPYIDGTFGSFTVGHRCGLSNTLVNLEGGSVTVGDYSFFGPNVMLLTGSHDFHLGGRVSVYLERRHGRWPGNGAEVPRGNRDIVIGKGSWIAAGAIVLGGVNIGDNVIVAAGAVVTKNVEDFAIVAGIPASKIGDTRDRTSPLADQ